MYEAKTRLSELLRRVRSGGRIIITVRGEEVAELRLIERTAGGLEAWIARLEELGLITKAKRQARFVTLARRPGVLARFLAERQ